MRLGLDEVRDHSLSSEVLLGELTESIATDLADEASECSAATRPHGDVRRASTRSEHHFAEGVTASEKFRVRADEYVPCEVTEDAQ